MAPSAAERRLLKTRRRLDGRSGGAVRAVPGERVLQRRQLSTEFPLVQEGAAQSLEVGVPGSDRPPDVLQRTTQRAGKGLERSRGRPQGALRERR